MYKVFINDSSLEIISSRADFSGSAVKYRDIDQLTEIIKEIENSDGIRHQSIHSDDPNRLWEDFLKHFSLIEAAGGIVKNRNEEILMIYRLGKWDLPKGKIEEEESVEEAAIREVEEECGIGGLDIVRELPVMYHTYMLDGRRVLKRTYWFEMRTEYAPELVPQIEEHIEKAQWINPDFLNEYLGNTYGSIRWLLNTVMEQEQ